MRFLRRVCAILLLALWLPATLHCELETAGFFAECSGCHEQADASGRDNDADGCAIVEAGAYRIDVLGIKAPVPGAMLVLLVIPPPAMEVVTAGHLDETAASSDIFRTWQFVRRAARPTRAPARMG